MKNATGISRWTSANRNHAVHIINDEGGFVLCGKKFFSHNYEPFNLEEVTCDKCKREYEKLKLKMK